MNPNEISKLRRKAESFKQSLIKKAKRRGLYENFGQAEVHKLQDMVGSNMYTAPQEVRNILASFDEWCMNYTGVE